MPAGGDPNFQTRMFGTQTSTAPRVPPPGYMASGGAGQFNTMASANSQFNTMAPSNFKSGYDPSGYNVDVNPVSTNDNPFMTQKDMRSTSASPRGAMPMGADNPFAAEGDSKHKVDWANWAGQDVTFKMNELIEANGLEDPTAGRTLLEVFGTNARGRVKSLQVSKGIKSLTFEENKRLGNIYDLTPLFEDDSWRQPIAANMEAYDAADNLMDPVDVWIMGFEADGSRRIDKWNADPGYVEVGPDGTLIDYNRVQLAKLSSGADELPDDSKSLGYERWFDSANIEHMTMQQTLAMRYFRELCSLVETRRLDPNNPEAQDTMWTNDPKVFPLPKELRAEGREGMPPWEQGIMPFPPEQRNYFVPNSLKHDSYAIDVYIADYDNIFPVSGQDKPRGRSGGGRQRSQSPAARGQGEGMKYRILCSTESGNSSIIESELMDPAFHNGFHDWGKLDEYKMPPDYELPMALQANHHPRTSLEHLSAREQEEYGLTFSIVDAFGNLYAQGRAPPSQYYNWKEMKDYRQHMAMALKRCSKWMRVPMTLVNAKKPQQSRNNGALQQGQEPCLWVHARVYAGKEMKKKEEPGVLDLMGCGHNRDNDAAPPPEEGPPPIPWDLRTTKGADANVFGPAPGHPVQAPSPMHEWRKEQRSHGDHGKRWTDMSAYAKSQWQVLGWSEANWDSENPGNYPASEKKRFKQLSQVEQSAATQLGFQAQTWDKFEQAAQGMSALPKPKPLDETESWCRLTEFGHSNSELGFAVVFETMDGEKSNCGKVMRGELDNGYFVEALNAISCRPKLAQQLFYAWDVSKGIYILRMMCNGTWVRVEIDDYVPPRIGEEAQRSNSPAVCHSEHFPYVLWPSLVEKAYAKMHTVRPPYGNSGGWVATGGGGRVEEALADLTGGVAGRFSTQDASYDRLFIYLYRLQRHCLWVARANKINCQKHGVILADGFPTYVVNRAAPYQGETYVQLFCAGSDVHIDGAGLQTYSVPLELPNMFPEKSGSGYFWVHMLDFSTYFDTIYECRLTNSPDVGLKDMPDFAIPMGLSIPNQSLGAQSFGPNLFKEIVVANKGALTPENPPEFDIFVPGAACPCEITCSLQQVNPRTDQMGSVRPLAVPLLVKVYQQTSMGGDNYSSDLVCKSNWLPIRDAMVSFSPKKGGRFLLTCGFATPNAVVHTMVLRVYSSCDGVVVTARTAFKSHNVVAASADNESRAMKWTLVGCRAAHRSDDTQPEPYSAQLDGLKIPVVENDGKCTVM